MPSMRHAILGVGGVGGLIGACLARSGASVTVVVRPESLAQFPESLHLESAFGNFSVPVSRAVRSSRRRRALDCSEGHATGCGALAAFTKA